MEKALETIVADEMTNIYKLEVERWFLALTAQELAKEVKFKYKFYMVPGGGYGSLKNGRSIYILVFIIIINAKCVLVKSRAESEIK